MCGRYFLTSPAQALENLFGFVERPNLPPRYNIAPTQEVPVIRQRRMPAGERTLQLLRWGLIPAWAEDARIGSRMINARAETLTEKIAFRTAFRRRRCLVPADGFYEWQGEGEAKTAHLIGRRDGGPFAFAGLWERWMPAEAGAQSIDSFTIITTAANDLLRPLHHRMPVILPPESYAAWLEPDAEPVVLAALLRPAPNELMRHMPVGRAVNAVRNDTPAVLEPAGPEVCWP